MSWVRFTQKRQHLSFLIFNEGGGVVCKEALWMLLAEGRFDLLVLLS